MSARGLHIYFIVMCISNLVNVVYVSGLEKPRFLKKVFRFFVQRPKTKVQVKHMKNVHTWYILSLFTDYSIQNHRHQTKHKFRPN